MAQTYLDQERFVRIWLNAHFQRKTITVQVLHNNQAESLVSYPSVGLVPQQNVAIQIRINAKFFQRWKLIV